MHTTCLRMDSVLHALVYHVFNIYMSCCNLLCLFSLVLMLLLNVDILCLLAGFDLTHSLTYYTNKELSKIEMMFVKFLIESVNSAHGIRNNQNISVFNSASPLQFKTF